MNRVTLKRTLAGDDILGVSSTNRPIAGLVPRAYPRTYSGPEA